MRAMILAAGRGQRMQAVARQIPKPMLEVAGKPLLEHLVCSLVGQGIRELVINHAWMGARIEQHLGDGGRWGAAIRYSPEGEQPTGTLAGVRQALPLLGEAPFLLLCADVWTDYPFGRLQALAPDAQAHLVLVDNPAYHPAGDFALAGGRVQSAGAPRYTYSGFGLYRPALFRAGPTELGPELHRSAAQGRLSGEHYTGIWLDIGTPERLAQARAQGEARTGSAGV